jgi:hypothetical protein
MPVTPEDVEAEHMAAIESLTKEQHRALARMQRAYQLSHFNHHKLIENLKEIFRREAVQRTEAAERRGASE